MKLGYFIPDRKILIVGNNNLSKFYVELLSEYNFKFFFINNLSLNKNTYLTVDECIERNPTGFRAVFLCDKKYEYYLDNLKYVSNIFLTPYIFDNFDYYVEYMQIIGKELIHLKNNLFEQSIIDFSETVEKNKYNLFIITCFNRDINSLTQLIIFFHLLTKKNNLEGVQITYEKNQIILSINGSIFFLTFNTSNIGYKNIITIDAFNSKRKHEYLEIDLFSLNSYKKMIKTFLNKYNIEYEIKRNYDLDCLIKNISETLYIF